MNQIVISHHLTLVESKACATLKPFLRMYRSSY